MVTKIISGAQTGADQAGLDAALLLGLEPGGWITRDARTERGTLTDEQIARWKLQRHSSWKYDARTEKNISESDGTVIFGNLGSPGSICAIKACGKWNKPQLGNPVSPDALRQWCVEKGIRTLNVAGNRESTNPGIYKRTVDFLMLAFAPAKVV